MSRSPVRAVMHVVAVAALITTLPPAVGAQAAAPGAPAGWTWRLDGPATFSAGGKAIGTDSLFEFTSMAPGWHLTMGPGAILFDPREIADHRYILSAEMILFPDASMDGEYGIFVGGRALDGPAPQWFAFVARGDGSAAVIQREGTTTRLVRPWTPTAAVKPRAAGATARNVVQLRAEADSIHFMVNGERVAAFARSDLDVNGAFGFRVGRGVNLHVTNLDITRRLAPVPRR